MGSTASAHPSKAFFVEMLTRDIELLDAVLDLVDNCIDGVHRQVGKRAEAAKKPYEGFSAEIRLDKKHFSIVDNCGGIPRKLAEESAFRLGRPATLRQEQLPTVGVYGIGMKRAIFKMGRSSKVASVNAGKAYEVSITKQWMESDDDWALPIRDITKATAGAMLSENGGTSITVSNLLEGIGEEFDAQTGQFETLLNSTIATHYSYVIHKGFSIKVNGRVVKPKDLSILMSRPGGQKQRIAPFIFETTTDGVRVDLVVGLYKNLPSEKDINDELEGDAPSASRETCGWTVICNDRVVLYNDKSRVTGWGEAAVPSYHPQFNAIAGIVRFRGDMKKLPVTTTKRGLDTSSELYLAVKDQMREGMKLFTNFTNYWKEHKRQRDVLISETIRRDPFEAKSSIAAADWKEVRKSIGGKKFTPDLPRPPKIDARVSDVVIRFSRQKDDVDSVADFLFDDIDVEPGKVGAYCFDHFLKRSKR